MKTVSYLITELMAVQQLDIKVSFSLKTLVTSYLVDQIRNELSLSAHLRAS